VQEHTGRRHTYELEKRDLSGLWLAELRRFEGVGDCADDEIWWLVMSTEEMEHARASDSARDMVETEVAELVPLEPAEYIEERGGE
jgi:hypothetical protein